jgi:hypothetical protein
MRSRVYLILILLPLLFIVAGCKATMLVHNASVKDIIPIFKDYAGVHGYVIRYSNDKTGSYNLDMGSVYKEGISSTVKSQSTIVQMPPAGSSQPMTAYEQTTWNTVNNPAHYAQATAAVNIIQQNNDVLIIIQTNDVGGGPSLNDLSDYLKALGYQVDSK